MGVARSGVPGQQLDPAVLGVLRPVRDDVPDAERSGHRQPADGRRRRSSTSGWLPIGLVLLFLTGVGPLLAWRKSTLSNLRDQFLWPVLAGARDRRRAGGARRSRLGVGAVLRAVRRSSSATIAQEFWRGANVRRGEHRHRPLHGARRPGRPQQAPLRRLHRPPRHRADLPRLRRQRLQARRSRCC